MFASFQLLRGSETTRVPSTDHASGHQYSRKLAERCQRAVQCLRPSRTSVFCTATVCHRAFDLCTTRVPIPVRTGSSISPYMWNSECIIPTSGASKRTCIIGVSRVLVRNGPLAPCRRPINSKFSAALGPCTINGDELGVVGQRLYHPSW